MTMLDGVQSILKELSGMTYELRVKITRPDNGHSTKANIRVEADSEEQARERAAMPQGYSGYQIDKILEVNQLP